MEGREEAREGEWPSKLIKLLWIKNSVWECNYGEMPDAVSFPTEGCSAGVGTGMDGWMEGMEREKTRQQQQQHKSCGGIFYDACVHFYFFIFFPALMKPRIPA